MAAASPGPCLPPQLAPFVRELHPSAQHPKCRRGVGLACRSRTPGSRSIPLSCWHGPGSSRASWISAPCPTWRRQSKAIALETCWSLLSPVSLAGQQHPLLCLAVQVSPGSTARSDEHLGGSCRSFRGGRWARGRGSRHPREQASAGAGVRGSRHPRPSWVTQVPLTQQGGAAGPAALSALPQWHPVAKRITTAGRGSGGDTGPGGTLAPGAHSPTGTPSPSLPTPPRRQGWDAGG